MALGATRAEVLGMLLRESLKVAATGLAAGLLIALMSMGLIASLLFGVEPRDPITFSVSFVIVVLVTLTASLWPARQAASVEPIQALRTE